MSDITAQYRRLLTAYEQPTLALLAKDTAIPTLTVLRAMFSKSSRPYPRSGCTTRSPFSWVSCEMPGSLMCPLVTAATCVVSGVGARQLADPPN